MKKELYLGIDGGGSKCALRVEDAEGQLITKTHSGPANISTSVQQAWASIRQACEQAGFSFTNEDVNLHVGMGLAGTENAKAVQAFLSTPHPFATLNLASDAHVACLGAHAGKNGAIIISGTGIVGYALQDGKKTKVSGWGFPLLDVGSGAWIGFEAIRCMLKWQDKRCRSTPLLEALFEKVGPEIVEFSAHADASTYAAFAPLVIEYAQDPVAEHLLNFAAKEIEIIYQTLCRDQRHPPLCLHGSIAKHLMPYLSLGFINNLVAVEGDAMQGAISLVRG